MKLKTYLRSTIGFAIFLFGSHCWAVCYVDGNATGKNDGSSWANAFVHPQYALLKGCKEIWVSKGVYTPVVAGSDPTISFDIPAGTKMYGGFAGSETAVEQRLPVTNPTVLSGDVDHNDWNVALTDRDFQTIKGVNSDHIVSLEATASSPILSNTILDGFWIVAGQTHIDGDAGPALICRGERPTDECSPTLNNLIFLGNLDWNGGGAVAFTTNANPMILNSTFAKNVGGDFGGALSSYSGFGTLTVANCSYFSNTAGEGGAIWTAGGVNIVNSSFSSNHASSGGAIFLSSKRGAPTPFNELDEVTFYGNDATYGGAIYLDVPASLFEQVSFEAINTIFWGNSVLKTGEDYYVSSPRFSIAYVSNSIVEHGCQNEFDICLDISTADPRISEVKDSTGLGHILLPGVGGSAIDKADDIICRKTAPVDQRGIARPQGAHCDIGAIEWRQSDDLIFRDGFNK